MNSKSVLIGNREIGRQYPTYFIADLASNHGGNLEIAKELIHEAAAAGADAAKFQHFRAETLVSARGFEKLGSVDSHQQSWTESVFETYRAMEVPEEWTFELAQECKRNEIDFLTAPYHFEGIDLLDEFLPAYKVGSGDLTFHESVMKMASKGKAILLATGASSFGEIEEIVEKVLTVNSQVVLMQCNTNYTGKLENSNFANLKVLEQFAERFPEVVLGLSDHTSDDLTTIAAVTLGARVVEKHFKGTNSPSNPDLEFSLNAEEWSKMVQKIRRLEMALGDGSKKVEQNEEITRVLQRRCIRYSKRLDAGHVLSAADLVFLRPAPVESLPPSFSQAVIGKVLVKSVELQDCVSVADYE